MFGFTNWQLRGQSLVGFGQDPVAEFSNFGSALIARSKAQKVHLSPNAAEIVAPKSDKASGGKFGLLLLIQTLPHE